MKPKERKFTNCLREHEGYEKGGARGSLALAAFVVLNIDRLSIYNSSNLCVCVSVCLRSPFLDDHRSDLIETSQEYCRGPADVPFQGLILIGQAVPKLRPFIYQPMTGHGAMTSRVSSQFFFSTYGHAPTGTHVRARTSLSIIPAVSVCVCLSVCMCVCDRCFSTTAGPI